nr:ubiquitin carboxyl-terminal hydrolase 8-like isoform X2 [Leptinotarsa decemlineata]
MVILRYKTEISLGSERDTMETKFENERCDDSSVTSSSGQYITVGRTNEEYKEAPLFLDKFISPGELLTAAMKSSNMLIVDIRKAKYFCISRIQLESGLMINIPEDLVQPGLSANILVQNLGPETGAIWNKRDIYDTIVLMDYNTSNLTYHGSKLEVLGNLIIKWDVNHRYEREPYILDGGIKEFADRFPSEIDDTHIILSHNNSEIVEFSDLESIHSTNSITNLESRIQRDFELEETEAYNLHSRSEGNLPVDFYESDDSNPAGPFSSLSQDSLSREHSVTELTHSDFFTLVKCMEALSLSEGNELDKVIADTRTILLGTTGGEVEHIDEVISKDQDSSELSGKTHIIEQPLVIRSRSPERQNYGEGYTGLINVGNICYMNCMLQCLKVLPVIKATYVTSDLYLKFQTRTPLKINHIMADVFREIWKGSDSNQNIFFIEEFKKKIVEIAPQFGKNTHEDAFEFFIFLSKVINEDCSLDLLQSPVMTEQENAWYSLLQGHTSFWVDTFYYLLKNSRTCNKCHHTNSVFETDSTLMVPIDKSTKHLQLLIDNYMTSNLVLNYVCTKCQQSSRILNKKEIIVHPEVLVIMLKRYIVYPDGTCKKITSPIEFPLEGLSFGSCKYNCYSIVHHSGSANCGHYFATVLLDGKWVSFSDEKMKTFRFAFNESVAVQRTAVGFFYVHQGKN